MSSRRECAAVHGRREAMNPGGTMRAMLCALLVGAGVIAGCGGGDEEGWGATPAPTQEAASGGGGGATLKFSAPADGALEFDQGDVTAQAGTVTVNFSNPSSVPHAVEIEGNGVEEETETVTGGDAPPIEVELEPGTYTFYCPVGRGPRGRPGEEARGEVVGVGARGVHLGQRLAARRAGDRRDVGPRPRVG